MSTGMNNGFITLSAGQGKFNVHGNSFCFMPPRTNNVPALQLVKFYGRSKSQSCKGNRRSQCDSKTYLVAGGPTIRVPGLGGALSTASASSPGSGQPPRLTEDSVGSLLQAVSHLQGCCFLQEGEFFAWNFIWTRFYEECISSGKF